MNRAIRLTRLHALNWYGYRDTIAVEGNALVAGVTGSGKSILMDLIQFVLVGDLRLVKFNQSATGDRSDRTLKGYCLGDTKQEEAGITQYMREAAISYVALEFTWPGARRVETWGFRIEFAGAAEGHGRVTPFFIPTSLARSDFLDEERRPLTHAAFRALAESHTAGDGVAGRVYAELGEYLRDMSQPAHLNFDRAVLRALLPSAMSFTFLRSFNEFCRAFILPADRLDVRDVTDSYKAFIAYERQLAELRDQHARLGAIAAHFQKHCELRRDAALTRWLEAECRRDHARALLAEGERLLGELAAACAEENTRLAELAESIPKLRGEQESVKNTIRDLGGALYLELKRQNAELAAKIERLRGVGRSLESALAARVRNAREWVQSAAALPLETDAALVPAVERGILAMESGGIAKFHATFNALREAAQKLAADVSRRGRPTLDRVAKVQTHRNELKADIDALALGLPLRNATLLNALNNSLLARGAEPAARHLRELCEVSDERWRPAIEIAFKRKFAVVVDAADYDAAEKIYYDLRDAAPGESVVNPIKALRDARPVKPGSLAEKITASHPVAAAVVSQLFGALICIERREQLREHDAAIVPDGFMSRGAFVERPRHYDNLPFVGKRGLDQQRAFKERQRAELEAEERRLRPLAEAIEEVQRGWRELFDPPPSLWQDLATASELPALQQQLKENIARLNQIDRAKFDDLAQRDSDLTVQIAKLDEEQRGLLGSAKRHQFAQQEKIVNDLRAEAEARKRTFESVNKDPDVSQWLPRLAELREEVMAPLLQKADAAAAEFNARFHTAHEATATEWERVKSEREKLALTHPKFDDLPIDVTDNAAYDRQLAKLHDADIPTYSEKSAHERRTWEKLFRSQVLEKLRSALFDVENSRQLLNNLLKRPIGNNRYRIVKWDNPDFALYHKLLEASALAHADELFFASADAELRAAIERFLSLLVEQPDSVEAARLLDYRHYFDFDMEVDDLDEFGAITATSRVDRQSGKYSGGENQSPYFIAILASYLRAYKRHDTRSRQPSLALVPIDEAFSKLSGERIKNCIEALAHLDLQGVFSMSTGNIPYAFEHCDSLVVVAKEERRIGKKLAIRNVPVSLHKDSPEARRLLGIE